jgi:hypothetical protein
MLMGSSRRGLNAASTVSPAGDAALRNKSFLFAQAICAGRRVGE